MSAQIIVLPAQKELSLESSSGGRAHRAMMVADTLCKRSGHPPFHPRRGYRNPVDATALDRFIAADFFKALSPKQLTCARDMLDIRETIIIGSAFLRERSSHQSQSRRFSDLGEKKSEVVGDE